MLKIYGSDFCPDCIRCKEELDGAGVAYEYLSITDDLRNLKAFLQLRDQKAFDEVKERGQIGIPCILDEAETISFQWEQYL